MNASIKQTYSGMYVRQPIALGGLSFCHVNGSSRVTRLADVRGPRYIPRHLLMLTASGDHDYAQLVWCKIINTKPMFSRKSLGAEIWFRSSLSKVFLLRRAMF